MSLIPFLYTVFNQEFPTDLRCSRLSPKSFFINYENEFLYPVMSCTSSGQICDNPSLTYLYICTEKLESEI